MVRIRPVDRLASELVVEKVASAVVVGAAVRVDGQWSEGLGAAGRLAWGDAPQVTTSTWFDLASLTKPITALAAARLARARLLDLAAPLGALLPEARGTPSEQVPLELFLAHRAGLDSHRTLFRHLARGQLASRSEALVEAASARRSDAQGAAPLEGFAPVYSDLGYLLVGEALARATGEALDITVDRAVLAPLGVAIGSARALAARDGGYWGAVAATEVVPWRGGTLRGLVHDENAWAHSGDGSSGHAGLFGTATGVLRVGELVVDVLYDRASWFLTKDELWPLVRPRPQGTLRAGFDSKSEQGSSSGTRFGPSTIGHLGFTGTSVWCDVDREMVGVLLTNRVHPTRDNDSIRRARPSAYERIAAWSEQRRAR
jgi:CubicO group peptidase (beta-lactamase class C family)